METEHLLTKKPLTNFEWYSQDYICKCVSEHLKKNGYKIYKPDVSETGSISIVASKYFKKELIEVKGLPKTFESQSAHGVSKSNSPVQTAKHWFSDALFNSFTNFGQYYTGENVLLAIALPNVERYKAIISRVHDYFTMNNLSFKIYLVNEDSDVEVSNLNDRALSNF